MRLGPGEGTMQHMSMFRIGHEGSWLAVPLSVRGGHRVQTCTGQYESHEHFPIPEPVELLLPTSCLPNVGVQTQKHDRSLAVPHTTPWQTMRPSTSFLCLSLPSSFHLLILIIWEKGPQGGQPKPLASCVWKFPLCTSSDDSPIKSSNHSQCHTTSYLLHLFVPQ